MVDNNRYCARHLIIDKFKSFIQEYRTTILIAFDYFSGQLNRVGVQRQRAVDGAVCVVHFIHKISTVCLEKYPS